MTILNTYKQVLKNQTLDNAWYNDAYICYATCEGYTEI